MAEIARGRAGHADQHIARRWQAEWIPLKNPTVTIRQDALHDGRLFYPCELLIEALIAKREPLMIDPEAVENGRLEIPDVHRVANDIVREFVRFSMDDAAFDSASRQP